MVCNIGSGCLAWFPTVNGFVKSIIPVWGAILSKCLANVLSKIAHPVMYFLSKYIRFQYIPVCSDTRPQLPVGTDYIFTLAMRWGAYRFDLIDLL